ncbi:MAG: pantetheine-phosphate adenylyltransferase [Chloroflexi bacterium]|nr:pantetheine-phosphate adenylyltransferase [Chloroflexota bacterium]
MTIAVYPGTFDPLHYGHMDIARRAARIFDELIVAIYDRPQKTLLFSAEERVAMAREALAGTPNLRIMPYHTLTVDFVREQGATVIVRGLRVISDFEMEYQMALTNRSLAPDIDSVCLMTSLEHAFISSSIVKEIAAGSGAVDHYVPAVVLKALRARFATR